MHGWSPSFLLIRINNFCQAKTTTLSVCRFIPDPDSCRRDHPFGQFALASMFVNPELGVAPEPG